MALPLTFNLMNMPAEMFQPMLPPWDEPHHITTASNICSPPQHAATQLPRKTSHTASARNIKSTHASSHASRSDIPIIVTMEHVTGPIGMHRLIEAGALLRLDDTHAFRAADGQSLYGRAAIISELLPNKLRICGSTAAWVWLGGNFPSSFEVLSRSHFRSQIVGRSIKTRTRRVPAEQITTIGDLHITTPERTACDLALCPSEEILARDLQHIIVQLMHHYEFTSYQCLEILDGCSYLHTAKQARAILTDFMCIA